MKKLQKLFCSGMTWVAVAILFVALASIFVEGMAAFYLFGWYVIIPGLMLFALEDHYGRKLQRFLSWAGVLIIVALTQLLVFLPVTAEPPLAFSLGNALGMILAEVSIALVPLALGFALHHKAGQGKFVVCPVRHAVA